jgi:hypothetical protein
MHSVETGADRRGPVAQWPDEPLDATIPAEVARFILSHYGEDIVGWIRSLERVGSPTALRQAGQLRVGLRKMQSSVALRNLIQARRGSEETSPEVPETRAQAAFSRCPPPVAGTRWLSVGEVATKAGISRELVTRLCRDEVLVATRTGKRGRPWSIDVESVAEYLESRSTADDR